MSTMKVRSDFVSNSSSSSFILYDSPMFEYFKITKEELNNAIIDLMGKDYINKYKADQAKMYKEHPEYMNEIDKKYGVESSYGPYWLYDMSIECDRKEALDRFGFLLSDWDSRLTSMTSVGKLGRAEKSMEYERACRNIAEIYHLDGCYDGIIKTKEEAKKLKIWTRTSEKQPDGCYGYSSPAPDFVGKLLLDIRKRCGIMTNKEVLEQECSKFFVHFDDNEIWQLNGSTMAGKNDRIYENAESDYEKKHNEEVKSSILTSESYTKERVFEILWNYWVKKGLINPDDKEFLKTIYLMDDYQKRKKEQHPKKYSYVKYNTHNEKNLSYHDLIDELLSFEGHEG